MARPREFDVEAATERALHLFWTKGYEGTTLADLTASMGINRPSLYAAFGSKEALFQRALERYVHDNSADIVAALAAPSGREVAYRIMRFHADASGRPGRPAGCLLVQGALVCGDESLPVRAVLAARREENLVATTKRFEQAKRAGDVLPAGKPVDLARWVWATCQGIAVQAATGATREQLRRTVDIAMLAWPLA